MPGTCTKRSVEETGEVSAAKVKIRKERLARKVPVENPRYLMNKEAGNTTEELKVRVGKKQIIKDNEN